MEEKEVLGKYADDVTKKWEFAKTLAAKILKVEGHKAFNLALAIFSKMDTPYHFFEKSNTPQDVPSEKQIKYAESLKISNPEKYTRKDLGTKIREVVGDGKPNSTE